MNSFNSILNWRGTSVKTWSTGIELGTGRGGKGSWQEKLFVITRRPYYVGVRKAGFHCNPLSKNGFFLGHLLQVLTIGSMPTTFKTYLHKGVLDSSRNVTNSVWKLIPKELWVLTWLCVLIVSFAPVVFYFPYTLFLCFMLHSFFYVFPFQAEYLYFISRF